MIVGYKLIDKEKKVVSSWGGVYGQCPEPPNPLFLPNGGVVHAPFLNAEYEGYTLIPWKMSAPDPSTVVEKAKSSIVTAKQLRLMLLKVDQLDEAEKIVETFDRGMKVMWEYGTEFKYDDKMLVELSKQLNMSQKDYDFFFIEASQL